MKVLLDIDEEYYNQAVMLNTNIPSNSFLAKASASGFDNSGIKLQIIAPTTKNTATIM